MQSSKVEARPVKETQVVLFVKHAYVPVSDAVRKHISTLSVNEAPSNGEKGSLMNNKPNRVNWLTRHEIVDVLKWAIRQRDPLYIAHYMDISSFNDDDRKLCVLTYAAMKATFAKTLDAPRAEKAARMLWQYVADNDPENCELVEQLEDALCARISNINDTEEEAQ